MHGQSGANATTLCGRQSFQLTLPRFHVQQLRGPANTLGLAWRSEVVSRMRSPLVVEALDPIDDVQTCLGSWPVSMPVDVLDLQGLEEALYRGIDAPMSSNAGRVGQVGKDKRVQLPDDVSFQAAMDFFV